jgi:hypothetical protein
MNPTFRAAALHARELVPAAIGACLIALFVAMGGAILSAAGRGSAAIGELALLFVPITCVPFAASTGAIVLPSISLVRAVSVPAGHGYSARRDCVGRDHVEPGWAFHTGRKAGWNALFIDGREMTREPLSATSRVPRAMAC